MRMRTKLIQSDNDISGTLMILVTSAPTSGDSKRIKEIGFSGYLPKPLYSNELATIISVLLVAQKEGKNMPLVTRHTIKSEPTPENKKILFNHKHILLVEDNPVNQMIASTILENLGCIITPAGNGVEALDMFNQQSFHLIFMDCQMPVMDGLEATTKIRIIEREKNLKRTPIIAFTANAMKGDSEACIASGMDDYLAKPVWQKSMEKILTRWITDKDDAITEMEQNEDEDQTLDYDVLDNLKALTNGQHLGIMRMYLEISAKTVPAITLAVQKNDVESLIREAHFFKSSSIQIGAVQLGDLIIQLEKFAQNENLEGIEPRQ